MKIMRICTICGNDQIIDEGDESLGVCTICGNDLKDKALPRIDYTPPPLPPPSKYAEGIIALIIVPVGILLVGFFLYIMMLAYSN